jgi:hypothetical protein
MLACRWVCDTSTVPLSTTTRLLGAVMVLQQVHRELNPPPIMDVHVNVNVLFLFGKPAEYKTNLGIAVVFLKGYNHFHV